jgi:hypothetical protein
MAKTLQLAGAVKTNVRSLSGFFCSADVRRLSNFG